MTLITGRDTKVCNVCSLQSNFRVILHGNPKSNAP
jgi:hypothetical protein